MRVVPSYVLGWSLLFVVAMGLLLRSFFQIQRWRRDRRARKSMSPRQIADAAKQAIDNAPHAKSAAASKTSAPAEVPASDSLPAATVAATGPSIESTLAPGADYAGPQPPATAPSWAKQPLPEGAQAPAIDGTLQPAGADWTPPPVRLEPIVHVEQSAPQLNPTPPAGPLVIHEPSISGTVAQAVAMAAPEPAPMTHSQPSIDATLTPGAAYTPQAATPAPNWERLALPDGVDAADPAATLQPAGATWTPPPSPQPPEDVPSIERPAPVIRPTEPLGPLVIQRPSIEGTLPSETLSAAENDPSPAVKAWIAQPATTEASEYAQTAVAPARSLSAGATAQTSTFRIAASRPAPIPRPAPPSWSIVAVKTSLPFRVRRPDTRLVGKTAREVVLISKARDATRILGRAFKPRLSGAGRRPPLVH